MFKQLRKEKGFTQAELAEKLEVGQNTISNWENGVSKPDIYMADKISKTFCCDLSEVIKCFVNKAEE
jgi:DNA-binding XRE family transcriptional regulator